MNMLTLIRQTFPALTPDECVSLLWEATAFPMGSVNHVTKQIIEWRDRANDLETVLYLAYGELDLVMSGYYDESPAC